MSLGYRVAREAMQDSIGLMKPVHARGLSIKMIGAHERAAVSNVCLNGKFSEVADV
jgi:hypothetical protein